MGGFSFAQLPNGVFDPRQIDPTPSFIVPPLADYKVIAVSSEPKETNDKTGGYIQFNLQIIEGQYVNVVVPYRLNIFNKDQRTVDIAYKQLSALGHVTAQLGPLQNSAQMHNIPFIAKIGPQKDNEQYPNVYAVMDLQGNVPGKRQANAVAASPIVAAPAVAAWPPQQPTAPAPAVASPWGPPQPNYAAPAPVQQIPWQPQAAVQLTCTNCKQPLAPGQPFCASCGKPAEQAQVAPVAVSAAPSTPPWIKQANQAQPAAPAVAAWPPK